MSLEFHADSSRRELLIGCGSRIQKDLWMDSDEPKFHGLVTLDLEEAHEPDVVWDLNERPLPFHDDYFDEVHAYEVLEHIGTQGDFRSFFAEWEEYWRILKPNGVFFASVPSRLSPWFWGDPGHTRGIVAESLVFLSQKAYEDQVGKTMMSDYRKFYNGDFVVLDAADDGNLFKFVLRALKSHRGARR